MVTDISKKVLTVKTSNIDTVEVPIETSSGKTSINVDCELDPKRPNSWRYGWTYDGFGSGGRSFLKFFKDVQKNDYVAGVVVSSNYWFINID